MAHTAHDGRPASSPSPQPYFRTPPAPPGAAAIRSAVGGSLRHGPRGLEPRLVVRPAGGREGRVWRCYVRRLLPNSGKGASDGALHDRSQRVQGRVLVLGWVTLFLMEGSARGNVKSEPTTLYVERSHLWAPPPFRDPTRLPTRTSTTLGARQLSLRFRPRKLGTAEHRPAFDSGPTIRACFAPMLGSPSSSCVACVSSRI